MKLCRRSHKICIPCLTEFLFAEYIPGSNTRRKLSLKRRKRGPKKELFPPEERPIPVTLVEVPEANFDLGFMSDDEENKENPSSIKEGNLHYMVPLSNSFEFLFRRINSYTLEIHPCFYML